MQSVYGAWVCRRVCVCVCVGLRQNRAAEMRQALQIFVGWLTAPCRCQAPTAETTKRRIRLALEPQIFSPPLHPSFSFLLLFSRSAARRLLWSGSYSIWQHSHPSVNLSMSLFRCDLMGGWWWGAGGSRKHGTWNTAGGLGSLPRCFFLFFFGHHLVPCSSLTPRPPFISVAEWEFWRIWFFPGFIFSPPYLLPLSRGFRATLPQKPRTQ